MKKILNPKDNPIRKLKCKSTGCKNVAVGYLRATPLCEEHFSQEKRKLKWGTYG